MTLEEDRLAAKSPRVYSGSIKTCRVCKCTEERPCNPPCGWDRNHQNLCTGCAAVIAAIRGWEAGAADPNFGCLITAATGGARTGERSGAMMTLEEERLAAKKKALAQRAAVKAARASRRVVTNRRWASSHPAKRVLTRHGR